MNLIGISYHTKSIVQTKNKISTQMYKYRVKMYKDFCKNKYIIVFKDIKM